MNNYNTTLLSADVLKQLASKHQSFRKSVKISQSELASKSGVSLGSIKRFESSGQISMESFLKLLFALGKLEEMVPILNPIDDLDQVEKLFSNKTRPNGSSQ